MVIWGVDVGTSNSAIARISGEEIDFYFLKFDSNLDPYTIHSIVYEFISGLEPVEGDIVSIESVFYRFNIKTLIRLSRVAHSLYIAFGEHGSNVSYVDNNTWRSRLFGTSKIKKEVCQEQAYEKWPQLMDYPKSKRSHLADAAWIAEYGRSRVE